MVAMVGGISHDGEPTIRGVECGVVATRRRSDVAIRIHGVAIWVNHRVSIRSQERCFVSSQLNGILVRPKTVANTRDTRRKGEKMEAEGAPTFNKTRTLEKRRSEGGGGGFERGVYDQNSPEAAIVTFEHGFPT